MHPETINNQTKRVLEKIGKAELGNKFYLAGGTSLAIHLGHRISIDLDWFSGKNFSNRDIKEKLSALGAFSLISEEDGTVHGTLDDVKVSFLRYKYGLLFPLIKFEGIQLADERDIAAMKIDAISSRGSKKDFIDIYFLLKKYSLADLLGFFEKKYSGISYNRLHLLKSLSYFTDAERQPMPTMIKPIEWETVKKYLSEQSQFLFK
jgi:predicted nucleotidyltransferase component of viral defense system